MNSINDFALNIAAQILKLLLQPAHTLYFAYGFATVSVLIVGKQLCMFAKPDSPYLSNVVRQISVPIYLLSNASALLGLITSFLLVTFAYLGGASLYEVYKLTKPIVFNLSGGVIFGLLVSLPIAWRYLPQISGGQGFTNANKILKKLRKLKNYDPIDFINIKKGCFVGREYQSKKPVYVPWAKINESHIQHCGASGSGKNIGMLLVAYQCVLAGQGLVWIDPKGDRRSPSVIENAARIAQKAFHYINLNLDQPAQFNMLLGCTEYEIEELLITGFDLQGTGSDGDFYRGKDQDAALLAGQIAVKEDALSIPELLAICSTVPEVYEQENFWRKFKKLASIPAICTNQGLDLEKAILNGDVIYLVGSCDNERVKMLQKMLLVRVMQVIKKRDRTCSNSPILVVLDEFKHLISPIALSSMGVIREVGHIAIAHQAVGDLEESPVVNPVSAYGAVITNTTLKFILKNNDVDFAKKLSESAGEISVYTNHSAKEIDNASEFISAKGAWTETKDLRIPAEVITALPVPSDRPNQASFCVFYGIDDAKILYLSPFLVKPSNLNVIKAPQISTDSLSVGKNGSDLI